MIDLTQQLERSITIRAPRDIVFSYFTDSARWANWWGAGSTIDPRPGGKVYVRYANGHEALGEVLSINPPNDLSFTWGFASGQPIGPGQSRVTISLRDEGEATRLTLTHELPSDQVRETHLQGWRYQLSLFSNVVANEIHANAMRSIDDWFADWVETDSTKRSATFSRIAIPDVLFQDQYSSLSGIEDLVEHSGAWQRFMSGVRLERKGDVRHCQGMVLSDWTVLTNDQPTGSGTNVFVFSPKGQIESVTGFWAPAS
jgi:uncharacterized protein YndB with AHSA1/START domain